MTIGQDFHDSPEFLDVLGTFLGREPIGDHNETFLIKVLAPSLLIFKGKPVPLFSLHLAIKKRIITNLCPTTLRKALVHYGQYL